MKTAQKVDIGRNLDRIYWGDGTPDNPGLSASQLAHHWGISKVRAEEVKKYKMTSIPAAWKHKYVTHIGGYRSGKTFVDIFKHVFKALSYPAYEALIVRKQHAMLRDTYLADFKKFIVKITDDNYNLLVVDEEENSGTWYIYIRGPAKTPAKFIFRIEPEGDMTKIRDSFKGYNLAGFTMEEASELKIETWKVLRSRMSRVDIPVHGSMLSNPGFRGQWLPAYANENELALVEGQDPDSLVIRSETYENAHNLPADYIPDLEKQYKNDPVGLAMALKGMDGVLDAGIPVFKGYFDPDKHVDAGIAFNPYLPLVRGWDFGFRHAHCGFWQFTKEGLAVKISEVDIENQYIEQFVDRVINHTETHYEPRAGIIDYGDYAGLQEKDTGSSIKRVRDYTKGKINIQARYFGDIDKGINHFKKLMSTTVNGKFRFRIHPRCTWTKEALLFGFFYKVMSDGRMNKKPLDNEYMHCWDADHYAICNAMPVEEERHTNQNQGVLRAKGLIHRKGR